MKKIFLTGGAILLIAGSVVFGMNATNNENLCSATEDCICCPCTPDCQPGNTNCTTECNK